MGDFQFLLVSPVVCLAAYGLLLMLSTPLHPRYPRLLPLTTLLGLGMAGLSLFRLWSEWRTGGPLETAYGLVHVDGIGLYLSLVVLIVALLSVLFSMTFLEREEADRGEFYPLMLFCVAGMFLMLQTTHLIVVLIGLEIFSLALYVLTGLTRSRARSVEAALKYFLLGAFSSGFMVYGMALLYGATGSLDLQRISSTAATAPGALLWIGMGLVLIGLAFKIAVVPFHQWVPDVYQGAPTNVTGFMAAATKTVALAVLLRLLVGAFGAYHDIWVPLVGGLAALTMTVANLVALAQTNLKRLLAFSSIAHAGYLLIGVVSASGEGVGAILFYLTVYAFMTVGAFAVLAAVGRGDAERESGYTLTEWHGLGWKRPVLGLAMAFFLFSLAGIPPTGGFLGKYVIFKAAIESKHYVLAVVGMVNAAIAAYYYLRVMVVMYMSEPESDELPLPASPGMATVMVVSVVGVIYLGISPGPVLNLIHSVTTALL